MDWPQVQIIIAQQWVIPVVPYFQRQWNSCTTDALMPSINASKSPTRAIGVKLLYYAASKISQCCCSSYYQRWWQNDKRDICAVAAVFVLLNKNKFWMKLAHFFWLDHFLKSYACWQNLLWTKINFSKEPH